MPHAVDRAETFDGTRIGKPTALSQGPSG